LEFAPTVNLALRNETNPLVRDAAKASGTPCGPRATPSGM
jgi:hypothetical protein